LILVLQEKNTPRTACVVTPIALWPMTLLTILHDIDTLQITPRVASTTRESRVRSAWAVARRIDEILAAAAPRQLFKPTAPGDEVDLATG